MFLTLVLIKIIFSQLKISLFNKQRCSLLLNLLFKMNMLSSLYCALKINFKQKNINNYYLHPNGHGIYFKNPFNYSVPTLYPSVPSMCLAHGYSRWVKFYNIEIHSGINNNKNLPVRRPDIYHGQMRNTVESIGNLRYFLNRHLNSMIS